MQKTMFNDRYALTQAVINEIKTNARRIEGGAQFQEMAQCADQIFYNEDTGLIDFMYEGIDIFNYKPRYKVGEVVAVAQSYKDAKVNFIHNRYDGSKWGNPERMPGWNNKMLVKAECMPHQIRITSVRCERLQDISDEDCMEEGIYVDCGDDAYAPHYFYDYPNNWSDGFDNPRAAFASLIDKVSERGTWERNPWVVVYEFELVK